MVSKLYSFGAKLIETLMKKINGLFHKSVSDYTSFCDKGTELTNFLNWGIHISKRLT
jgi:hypothetical protein